MNQLVNDPTLPEPKRYREDEIPAGRAFTRARALRRSLVGPTGEKDADLVWLKLRNGDSVLITTPTAGYVSSPVDGSQEALFVLLDLNITATIRNE